MNIYILCSLPHLLQSITYIFALHKAKIPFYTRRNGCKDLKIKSDYQKLISKFIANQFHYIMESIYQISSIYIFLFSRIIYLAVRNWARRSCGTELNLQTVCHPREAAETAQIDSNCGTQMAYLGQHTRNMPSKWRVGSKRSKRGGESGGHTGK